MTLITKHSKLPCTWSIILLDWLSREGLSYSLSKILLTLPNKLRDKLQDSKTLMILKQIITFNNLSAIPRTGINHSLGQWNYFLPMGMKWHRLPTFLPIQISYMFPFKIDIYLLTYLLKYAQRSFPEGIKLTYCFRASDFAQNSLQFLAIISVI